MNRETSPTRRDYREAGLHRKRVLNRRFFEILATVVVALGIGLDVGCSQFGCAGLFPWAAPAPVSRAATPSPAAWKTFQSADHLVSLTYPASWGDARAQGGPTDTTYTFASTFSIIIGYVESNGQPLSYAEEASREDSLADGTHALTVDGFATKEYLTNLRHGTQQSPLVLVLLPTADGKTIWLSMPLVNSGDRNSFEEVLSSVHFVHSSP